MINYMMGGTAEVRNQILLVVYLVVAILMLSGYLNEKIMLIIFIIFAGIIVIRFLSVGLWGEIFLSSSTNFVSVYLLFPVVVYYILRENRNLYIPIFPAGIVWMLSLLSRGRGGIICSSFLLLGIFAVTYKNSGITKKILVCFFIVLLILFIVLNIDKLISSINSSIISEYFRDRGLRSSRIMIWQDYIEQATGSWINIVAGLDINNTFAGRNFGGNPHNSFINIHMENGIIMLIIVSIGLIKKIVQSVKSNQLVFFVCATTFVMRSFTDNVFWGPYGTPVVFFLLFYNIPSVNKQLCMHNINQYPDLANKKISV